MSYRIFLLAALLYFGVPQTVQSADRTAVTTSSATTKVHNGCGPEFGGKCFCGYYMYDYKEHFVVNCTDTGFTNASMLETLPDRTEVLIFTGNKIVELPWNVFGAYNRTKLEIIDMSNNHLREIRGKSFHHVPNVRRLILNHNNLSIADDDEDDFNHHHSRVFSNFINLQELHLTNAFSDNTSAELAEDLHDIFVNSNLTKITKLHLEQNEIVSFKDRNVFCDLPSLRDLHLGDNYLRELNFNLECLKNLRFLDLERNRFVNVRVKDLKLMDRLETQSVRQTNLTVDFGRNPFVCDCALAPFLEWMSGGADDDRHRTKVTVRYNETLRCKRSSTSGGRLPAAPAESEATELMWDFKVSKCMVASKRLQTSAAGHTTLLTLMVIMLVCLLMVIVVAIVVKSRDRIKYVMSPIMDNISKKVHYTTIKNEEVQEVHV